MGIEDPDLTHCRRFHAPVWVQQHHFQFEQSASLTKHYNQKHCIESMYKLTLRIWAPASLVQQESVIFFPLNSDNSWRLAIPTSRLAVCNCFSWVSALFKALFLSNVYSANSKLQIRKVKNVTLHDKNPFSLNVNIHEQYITVSLH